MQYKIVTLAIIWHNRKILLVKKRLDIMHPYRGDWDFPGGQAKELENPWQAIIREVEEELDMKVEPLRVIDFKVRKVDFPQNKEKSGNMLIIFFEAVPVGKINFKVDRSELTRAKWIKLREADKYLKKEFFSGKVEKFINNLKRDGWKSASVVQCYLKNRNKIAIFKRTNKVGVYKNYWSTIAGYIQADNLPIEQAYIELEEEGGVKKDQLKLISRIGPVVRIDKKIKRIWIIYAFLFEIKGRKIKFDWEHSQVKWIEPNYFKKLRHVPGMPEILEKLLKNKYLC